MMMDSAARQIPAVLGIIGSSRKLGNCELAIKEISKRIGYEHDLRLIRLPELTIRPCRGCYRCLDEGMCAIEDDVAFLIRQIAAADALIVAAPVYFLTEHSSIKCLLDRGFSFFTHLEETARKPCILISTYGMKDRIGTAPQSLLTLAAFLGLRVKANVALQAALPGEVLASKRHLMTMERLAGLLFDKRPHRQRVRACPFCGCTIIRMRSRDFMCTLCHGSFHLDGSGKPVGDHSGWDVGDIAFVPHHRQWLVGMKEKFMARRKELLRLSLPYKDVGRWIEPGTDE